MTDLIKNDSITMTSLELALFTEKRHDNVFQKINTILNQVEDKEFANLNFKVSEYKDTTGRLLKEYVMSKSGSLFIASRYDVNLHLAVQKRWEELELKQQFTIPQTFSQALQLASKQAEQIELQKGTISIMEPKAEFYDAVTGSEDTIDMGRVAKVLNMGIGRTKLFMKLRELKILQNNNAPYQQFIDSGYFRIIESTYNKPDGSTHISLKTVVYQKGIAYIKKRLNS